jgi:hypothetical protein
MSGTPLGTDPSGWYADPAGLGQQRFWSGTAWTPWVWDGTDVVSSPLPQGAFEAPNTDREHLRYVRDVFLPRARAHHVVSPMAIAAMDDFARNEARASSRREPVTAGAAAPGRPATDRPRPADLPAFRPPPTVAPPPSVPRPASAKPPAAALVRFEPRPYHPGPVARWWDRTKDAVGSDLTTNGLAYLGVLLLFVGVFGLVAFAFGDVAEGARPLAELGIALAPFAASWMLLRRGAVIAGRALETAGGLLLPIMLVTSFLDGVPVPPDLTGTALVVALTVVTAAVAAAYAFWSHGHPESTLRYLVAPAAWLSVALATMGVGREVPSGKGVASITAAQIAAVSIAMLVTLAWAWARPRSRLSAPTFTSTVPALVILTPITIVAWAVGGWPQIAIAVTGVAGLLVLELMIGRLRRSVITTIQPLWWAVVSLALLPSMGLAPAAVCAAAGFLALLELESSDGASTRAMALSTTGLGLALLGVWSEPWWAFAALIPLTAWAHARRLRPFAPSAAPLLLDLAAALFPMGVVVALGMATRHAPMAVLIGAVLALLAAWPATRRGAQPLLKRDAHDHFWVLWWDAAMVVSVLATALMAGTAWPSAVAARWMLVAAVAVLTLSSVVGPLPPALRPWVVLSLATWGWLLVGWMLALPVLPLALVPAVAAVAVVVAVHARPDALTRWQHPGSSAWAGLTLGATAVVLTGGSLGWALVLTMALATSAWLVVTAWTAVGRSPATEVVRSVAAPAADWIPGVVSVVGLAATALLFLDAAGLVAVTSLWAPVVVAAVALCYAAATRLPVGETLAVTLTWAACIGAVGAPMLTSSELPALVALLALVVTVLVLPAARRPIGMVWLAWAAVAPIVALGIVRDTTFYDGLSTASALATTLVGVGAAMALTGMAFDLRGRAWEPVWRPRRPAFVPVVALGAAEVVAGFAIATVVVPWATAGWITTFVVLVLVGTACLARAWSLVGAAAGLAWLAALQLRGDDVLHAPWLSVVVTVVLLAGTELAHRVVHDDRLWVRGDWILAAVAHVTAVTALLSAGTHASFSLTYLAIGLLAVAVAARVRTLPPIAASYALLGDVLVLISAAYAGPGWLALALAVTSVACSALATRATAALRWTLLCAGAATALASWLSVAVWLEWTPTQVVDRTVLLGGAITLLTAVLLRWTRIDRTVVIVRGGLAVLTATLTPVLSGVLATATMAVTVSWATCTALAVLGLSAVLAARPLAVGWIRYAAPAYLLAAGAELSYLLHADSAQQLSALAVATVVCALALAGPWARDAWTAWRGPVLALGVATSALALLVGLTTLPDSTLLAPALLVAAVMSAAIALELRSLVAQVCTPVLVCTAWIVYAARALDGNPQWYAVPVGLTMLVVVGLLRHRLRTAGHDPAPLEVVLLELTGIGALVGTSFVQAFTVALAYAALAAVLGLLVAGWGVLTKVRRRVTAGIVIAFAALLVLVGVPLAQLLPAWSGVTLWVTIALVGLLAIVGATLLEKGRAVLRAGLDSFAAVTQGWE